MSELAKETISNLGASPKTSEVDLYSRDGIRIFLELPIQVTLKRNGDDAYCTCAPILENKTPYPISSAEFTITLNDVKSTTSPADTLVNVVWWDPESYKSYKTMTFKCDTTVDASKSSKCSPDSPDVSQVQWISKELKGGGKQTLDSTLAFVSLSYIPDVSTSNILDGANITVE
ncbi:hypothetical protein HZF02_16710 [Pseudomonas yamanorum]|nr:hypothetical protein HZF02_16710 [Pseudomonas yamanorum]